MHRSRWGTKENQQVILALRLRREFFEILLAQAVSTTWERQRFATLDWLFQQLPMYSSLNDVGTPTVCHTGGVGQRCEPVASAGTVGPRMIRGGIDSNAARFRLG